MLWEEIKKYRGLTGESADGVPIIKSYLDGYDRGMKEIEKIREKVKGLKGSAMIDYVSATSTIDTVLEIIDEHGEKNEEEILYTIHELKILPEYFEAIDEGGKCFELRKDDRGYKVHDTLFLREWDGKHYTGRKCTRNIAYILRNCPEYGLMDGYCILGF